MNPKEPLTSAYTFVRTIYTIDGTPTLMFYAGDYWQWMGNSYRQIEMGAVDKQLLLFLEKAKVESKIVDGIPVFEPFPVKPNTLNPIGTMLQKRFFQSAGNTVPCWIGDECCEMPASVTDPSLLIFGKSKIFNLENLEVLTSSPHWFNTAALDFDYDPNAKCPLWLIFLDSIFEDDEESKQTLMEWMGLCLTPITRESASFKTDRLPPSGWQRTVHKTVPGNIVQ